MHFSSLPLFILLMFIAVFMPFAGASAAVTEFVGPIVPCGVGGGGALSCQACQLVTLSQNIINFIIYLGTVVAVLMFVYAGFLYISAAGDTGKIKRAHGIFSAVLVGFIVVLAAWLFIDLLMKTFVGGKFGPWNKILCEPAAAPAPFTATPALPGGSGPAPVVGGGSVVPDGRFDYQASIAAQAGHASAALNKLLSCMANKVPGNVGVISSISDSAIVNGTKTFEECASEGSAGGVCAHTRNSCHYGGSLCTGESYAVDFGDEENAAALSRAAGECSGGFARVANEGNHIHISVPERTKCGCN